jgi:TetR/AcrR family transcriptional repressor of nem operon
MRYDPEHKARTHARILSAARRLLRREGVRGASVERVMRRAGLTVGGFYAHFASKDGLVAEALRAFMRERSAAWLAGIEGLRGGAWAEAFLGRYLNAIQRDDLERGCLLPSVLSELTQGRTATRQAAVDELESILSRMAPQLQPGRHATARQRAIALFVLSVGGLAVARVAQRTPLSDEVLEACIAFGREAIGDQA